MSGEAGARPPVLVSQFVNCLGIGGTERQLVEHVRRLDGELFSVHMACLQKVGEFLPVVQGLGIDPAEYSLRGTLMQPNTALQVYRLARRLSNEGARLLHCHDFYSNIVGAAAARLARIPYIISRRDMGVWIGPARARLLAMVTRTAPRVLCNAYAIRDQIVNEEGVAPERVTVVHNGLDLGRFDDESAKDPIDPPDFLNNHPTVALVANMKHAVKGHSEFLSAAAAVVRAVPEARFLLVGDGSLRRSLEEQALSLGIAHAVCFAGRRTDIPSVLARCHIAVCASHAEGLSNAVMEGMAARLPVVATGVGGNMELVRDGRSGFIVRKGDITGLAQRMTELIRQPLLARRMGIVGRRRIEDEYTVSHMAERMDALYCEMLNVRRELRRAA